MATGFLNTRSNAAQNQRSLKLRVMQVQRTVPMIGSSLHRWFQVTALALAGLLVSLACSPAGAQQSGKPASGGKVTVASWQEQDSLLAANITSTVTHAVAFANPVMEGLLAGKASTDVPRNPKISDYWNPSLATNVPTVENGDVKVTGATMAVTWKLRHGVKWHDGQAFTSKDVKATFDFWWLKYKDRNPTPIQSTSGWDQVDSVDTPNDFTAVVHWKSLLGTYLQYGSGPYGILPAHLLEKSWAAGGDITSTKLQIQIPGAFSGSATWDKFMVGTGPYMFKEWVTGDHLTLVRNPNWWGPHKPYLDQIMIRFEPDTNTQLADLQTSTIDMGLDFRAGLLSPLSHMENGVVVTQLESGAEKLDLNLRNKYLSDINVRKAILMAIDRQKIIDTLLQGKSSIPPDSWLCLGTGAWCADPSVPRTKFDPAAANALLDQAGYKKADSGPNKGLRIFKDGTPISLTLQTTASNALREQQEVVIAQDLLMIGVQIQKPFQNPPASNLYGAFSSGGILSNHAFDIAQYTYTYTGPAEPDAFYDTYVSTRIPTRENGGLGQNTTFTSDPTIDAAFKQGRSAVKQADRRSAYVTAQKRLAEIIPEIPLYQQLTVMGYNKRLKGIKFNEFYWLNNTYDWYLGS